MRASLPRLAFAFVLALPAAASSQSLFAGAHHPVGSRPRAVAWADLDLDLDGDLDLATANETTAGTVAVLLASAPGDFQPAVAYPVGERPASLAIADLDHDQLPDLVVANLTSWDLAVLRNLGGGTFGPATFLPIPWSVLALRPRSVAVADIDGDGHPDIASANSEYHGLENSITVFAGDGAGNFAPSIFLPLAAIPGRLKVADLDGNGALDFVLANYWATPHSVSVFLATSPGAFAPPVEHAIATSASGLALADFDGDGVTDLATSHFALQGSISILLGTGTGSFAPFAAVPAPSYAEAIASGDVDLDGDADLVTTGMGGAVASLLGDGAGGFAAPSFAPAGNAPMWVELADLNGDGALDAFTANSGTFPSAGPIPSGNVGVLLGDGQGRFGASAAGGGYAGAGAYPTDVALADLDHDGLGDLLLLNSGTNDVTLARGDGQGGVAPAGAFPVASPGSYPDAIALGDFDGDGRADAASANLSAHQVGVVLGAPGGGFGPPGLIAVGQYPNSVATADLDGDGRLDLVTANGNTHDLSLLFGDGLGGFAAAAPIPVATHPTDVAIGDVNQDGLSDLVSASAQGSVLDSLSVVVGAGGGAFLPPVTTAIAAVPVALAIGDLNGDSMPDLAVADSGLSVGVSAALVLIGNGAGAFSPPTAHPVGTLPAAIAIGDLDRDGKADLATANSYGDDVSILRGDGTGAFAPAASYAAGSKPQALAIADVDADGNPDVVTPNQATAWPLGRAVVLLGRSAPPRGLAPYGSGTPGCAGTHGLLANGPPALGNAAFALTGTNAPAGALGVGILASAQNAAGSDPLQIGVLLHVDLVASAAVIPVLFASDASGNAIAQVGIPANPGLAGATFYAQAAWIWPPASTCDPSPLGISSSHGLAIRL